jgi:hypothetical protein
MDESIITLFLVPGVRDAGEAVPWNLFQLTYNLFITDASGEARGNAAAKKKSGFCKIPVDYFPLIAYTLGP